MEYSRVELKDGKLVTVFSKEIDNSTLTSDCWSIQFEGLNACARCPFLNKRNCGGKNIRKKLLAGG